MNIESCDRRDLPGHWNPELDFLLWLRPDLTEAEATAIIERFERETWKGPFRTFRPGRGAYLAHAMAEYCRLPMRPDAAIPESNVVTLFGKIGDER